MKEVFSSILKQGKYKKILDVSIAYSEVRFGNSKSL